MPGPPARIDLLFVAALTLLAAALYPFAALITDSGRDFAWGLTIARGDAFPLYGPGLNRLWQPGPVWYYLLAGALWVSKSVGGAALVTGLLAAAKIPLAWALGRRLRDNALGLCCAAAIALPGWSTLGQLVISHTMLAEAAVLATLLLCWSALQRDRLRSAIASAAMLGLAVHAHPTALVATPAVAFVLLRVQGGWRIARMALAGLAFLLPFAPAIVAEAVAGWPQVGASAGYFGDSDYLARLLRAPAVAWGASVGQGVFVRDFLFGRWPDFAAIYFGAWCLLVAASAAGLIRAVIDDGRARIAVALLAVSWLFVLLLRDTTPAWMVYACAPAGALALAFGWRALWPVALRNDAARALAAFAVVAGAALLGDRIVATRTGVQSLPGTAIVDIAEAPVEAPPLRFWLPAFGHDAVARRACTYSGPASLHGDLATAIHFGQGVATTLHCAAPQVVTLGGHATLDYAGVPVRFAIELGIVGEATSFGYVIATPARVLYPESGERIALHTRYLADDFLARIGRDAPQTIRVRSACSPDEIVVVTDLVPGLNLPFEIRGEDGSAAPSPLTRSIASQYFSCPPSGSLALDIVVLEPAALDVFTLRVAAR